MSLDAGATLPHVFIANQDILAVRTSLKRKQATAKLFGRQVLS